jgi:hypothetical protein
MAYCDVSYSWWDSLINGQHKIVISNVTMDNAKLQREGWHCKCSKEQRVWTLLGNFVFEYMELFYIKNELKFFLVQVESWNKNITSAGFFLKHNDTNSFIGLEKCSSSCMLINILLMFSQEVYNKSFNARKLLDNIVKKYSNDLRRIFTRYHEKNSHGMNICQRGFTFCHFYSSYT